MRDKKWLLLLWLIIPVLPIVLNFIMLSSVEGCSVAGDVKSWIGFWGSYAGGCITALISFVILYLTIAYYREENNQRLQEAHKERLRTELSTRLSVLNTKKFTVYYDRLLEGQDPAALCKIIEETRVQIVNDFSSFKILYSGVYDMFIQMYEGITWRLETKLSWLSDTLSQIPDSDSPSRRVIIERAKERFDDLAELQPRIEEFWTMASKMIN